MLLLIIVILRRTWASFVIHANSGVSFGYTLAPCVRPHLSLKEFHMATPAIIGGLDGYETSFNLQHVNYVGAVGDDMHVFELSTTITAGITIRSLPNSPVLHPLPRSQSGARTRYDLFQPSARQLRRFRREQLHVFELYFDTAWHYNDLTKLTGAPAASRFPGEPHGYVTSCNNQQHVNFVGVDFHVHELYFDNAWHHNDLTQLTELRTLVS